MILFSFLGMLKIYYLNISLITKKINFPGKLKHLEKKVTRNLSWLL